MQEQSCEGAPQGMESRDRWHPGGGGTASTQLGAREDPATADASTNFDLTQTGDCHSPKTYTAFRDSRGWWSWSVLSEAEVI